ncbi:MAG: septation protein SepH [Ornithinimicrobium sp.]
MDQLRFTGLYEDGRHAVLTASDGSEFLVVIDDRLRAAVRRPSSSSSGRTTPATPREVQTQIRGGASTEEVAESTGWTVERIERYEGPILAEREYVAGLARAALIRTHERSEAPPTLESRVRERLGKRGVDLRQISWDSIRPTGGSWSVQVHFKAGQRARSASWSFNPDTRSVDAIDDEARWLSEDEQSLPAGAAATALLGGGSDAPDDLMSAMRERSKRRGASGRRRKSAPTHGPEDTPEGADDAGGDRHDDDGGRGGGDHDSGDHGSGGGGHDSGAGDHDSISNHGNSAVGLDIARSGQVSQDPSAVPDQHDLSNNALPLEGLPDGSRVRGPQTVDGADAAAPGHDGGRTTNHREASSGPGGDAARDENDGEPGHDLNVEAEDDSDWAEDEEREATLADFFGSDDDDDDGQVHDVLVDGGDDGHVGADDDRPVHDVLADGGDDGHVDDAGNAAETEGGGIDEPATDDGGERDGVDSPDILTSVDPQTPATPDPDRGEKSGKGSMRARKGRTSVPSWDDIMFGAKDRGR